MSNGNISQEWKIDLRYVYAKGTHKRRTAQVLLVASTKCNVSIVVQLKNILQLYFNYKVTLVTVSEDLFTLTIIKQSLFRLHIRITCITKYNLL